MGSWSNDILRKKTFRRNCVIFLIPRTFREQSPAHCFFPGFHLGTLLPTRFSSQSQTHSQQHLFCGQPLCMAQGVGPREPLLHRLRGASLRPLPSLFITGPGVRASSSPQGPQSLFTSELLSSFSNLGGDFCEEKFRIGQGEFSSNTQITESQNVKLFEWTFLRSVQKSIFTVSIEGRLCLYLLS